MTPEEIELLSDLTIIIPTYNRPLELERAIEYWRDIPVTVHILDGSEKPWFPPGPIKSASSVNYHHIPSERDQAPHESFFQRTLYGSKLPVTKFSAFGCDDDFYTISGLIGSLKVLKSDEKIDAVAGRVLTYERKGKVYWHHKYVPRKNRIDLETDSIKAKLATGSSWFLYAVCRTEIWQKFLLICYQEQKFTKLDDNADNAHEWMLYILCKAMFRTKYLEIIQLVRQDTVVRANVGANVGAKVPWTEFICDPKNFEVINAIISQLAKGFNLVTPKYEHDNNLRLARELMRADQVKANLVRNQLQAKGSFKGAIADIVFYFFPMFKVFADRPRRLKYMWRIPKYQYSAEQQQEVKEIEKLLLKPREELRLRANI